MRPDLADWAPIVLCSGTFPRTAPLVDRVVAASQAGFVGVTVWGRDYAQARADGHSDQELHDLMATHGIEVAEVDGVWGWTPGAPNLGPGVDPFLDHDEASLFTIADRLGARSINAVDVFGGDWSLDDATESFAALCDRAADRGLLVNLEALPWSRIPTVTEAMAIVASAGRANGGVTVDSWHLFRGHTSSGAALDAVRALDGSRVHSVQLSDGPSEPEADLVAAAMHHRELPGQGAFALTGLLRALKVIGADPIIGVEVFSDDLHRRGIDSVATMAAEAARSVVVQAASPT